MSDECSSCLEGISAIEFVPESENQPTILAVVIKSQGLVGNGTWEGGQSIWRSPESAKARIR